MRKPAIAMLVVLLAGFGVLIARALHGKELDAVRLGILAESQLMELDAGQQACEKPLDLDRPVKRMGVAVEATDGPPLDLEVQDYATGKRLAGARIPAGWTVEAHSQYVTDLDATVDTDRSVAVCVTNAGTKPVMLTGRQSIADAALTRDDGLTVQGDWAIYFPLTPEERRTYLGMSGDILRRASVLRPSFITPLTYVLLGLLLVVGGGWILVRAVRTAELES